MGLRSIFKTHERRSNGAISVIPAISGYIAKMQDEHNDRAPNVISPSSAGSCPRAQVIDRFVPRSKVDDRVQRIFDNGTYTHHRIQSYLRGAKVLLMAEVPLSQRTYNVQGHTDGFLFNLGTVNEYWWQAVDKKQKKIDFELVYALLMREPLKSVEILEIKTINMNQYGSLRTAKEEHKDQASTYAWCAEQRRRVLHKLYPTWKSFRLSHNQRYTYHEARYMHIPPKRRKLKVKECLLADAILYATQTPVERVVFLYENKNDQSLKEFVLKSEEDRIGRLKGEFLSIESSVASIKEHAKSSGFVPTLDDPSVVERLPPMPEEAKGRSCELCKWCDHKDVCYGRSRRGRKPQ